jgi:CHAT domain-containing protein/Tfp pilus assembly protein PilF
MTSDTHTNPDWLDLFQKLLSQYKLQYEQKHVLILSEVEELLADAEKALTRTNNLSDKPILLSTASSIASLAFKAARDTGDFKSALLYAEKGVEFSKEIGRNDIGLAKSLHNRGLAKYELGMLVDAEEDFLSALTIVGNDSSRSSQELRYLLRSHLAQVQFTRGEKEEAELNLYRSSLSQKFALIHTPPMALNWEDNINRMVNESAIALQNRAYDQAEKLLLRAFEIAQVKQLDAMAQGIVVWNLGNVYYEQQQWEPAIEYFKTAVRIHRNDPASRGPLAIDLHSLGLIYYRTGHFDQARKFFKEAWDTIRQVNIHSNTALNVLLLLGWCRVFEGDTRRGRAVFKKGLELYEEMRPKIARTEEGQEEIFKLYRALVEAMIHLALKDDWQDEVIFLTERAKARFWQERINSSLEDQQAFFSENTSLLNVNERMIDQKQSQHVKMSSYSELIRNSTHKGDFIKNDDVVVSLIGYNTLVLNYFVGPNAIFLTYLFNRTVNCVHLDIKERELFELIQEFRNDLMGSSRRAQYSENGKRLSEILLAKIELELPELRHIVVMPDGLLWYIPFGALPLPEKMSHRNKYTFLCELSPVSYAPSLTILRDLNQREAHEPEKKDNRRFLVVAQPEMSSQFSPVEGTLEEAAELSRKIDPKNITILRGNDATKANFLSYLPDMTHIHVGSHAIADLENASPSIVFAGSNGKEDFLYANEIMNQCTEAELVFLSACSTSIGRNSTGEGLMSLARAFILAGCQCVIATLWPIDDEEAALFVNIFYRYLLSSSSISAALRLTQLEFKRSSGSVRTWAAFQSVGYSDSFSEKFSPIPTNFLSGR